MTDSTETTGPACLEHAGCPCPAHHATPAPASDAFARAALWSTEEDFLIGELRSSAATKAAAREFLRKLGKLGAKLGIAALEALALAAASAAAADLEGKR